MGMMTAPFMPSKELNDEWLPDAGKYPFPPY